jgi:hypothetical protein
LSSSRTPAGGIDVDGSMAAALEILKTLGVVCIITEA